MGNQKDFRILKYQIGLLVIVSLSIGLIAGQQQDTTMQPSAADDMPTTHKGAEDSILTPSLASASDASMHNSSDTNASSPSASSLDAMDAVTTPASASAMPSTENKLSVVPLKDPAPTQDSINLEDNETDGGSSSPSSFGSFWDFTTAFQKGYLASHLNATAINHNTQAEANTSEQMMTSSSASPDSSAMSSSTASPITTTMEGLEVKALSSSTSSATATTTPATMEKMPKVDEESKDSPIIFIATTMPPQAASKSNSNDNSVEPNTIEPKANDVEGTTIMPALIHHHHDMENHMMSSESSLMGKEMKPEDAVGSNLSTEMLMTGETTIMPDMVDSSSEHLAFDVAVNELHSSSTTESESPVSSSSSSVVPDVMHMSSESDMISQSSERPAPIFVPVVVQTQETHESHMMPAADATTMSPQSQATTVMNEAEVEHHVTTMASLAEANTIMPAVLLISSDSRGRALNLNDTADHSMHLEHHHHEDEFVSSTMTTQQMSEEVAHHHPLVHGEGRSADASDPAVDEDPYHPHLHFVTTEKSPHYSAAMEDSKDNKTTTHKDLSDVSMEDDDSFDIIDNWHHNGTASSASNKSDGEEAFARQSVHAVGVTATSGCMENSKHYAHGETMNRDCDEKCTCNGSEWICATRCSGVYFKRGRTFADPLCSEKLSHEDECCATMICTDTTRHIDGDDDVYTIQHAEHQQNDSMSSTYAPLLPTILPATNTTLSTAGQAAALGCMHNGVMYRPRERLEIGCEQICFCEADGNMNCRKRCAERNHSPQEKCVLVKDPKDICCQLEFCDVTLDAHEQTEPPTSPSFASSSLSADSYEDNNDVKPINGSGDSCMHKGKAYKFGEEFHDGCEALCICTPEGVHCATLECPSKFGLEVLDPNCLQWEPEPASFTPIPPKCCPERMRCVNNGSCEYQGERFDNWSEIPSNYTGCEKHCYCEAGKIECRPACAPVPALPPPHLPCHQHDVRLLPIPNDECCKRWTCVTNDVASIENKPGHKGHKDKLKSQSASSSESDDNGKDSNSVGPFYPTIDGKPPKQLSDKPTKSKYNKDNGLLGPLNGQIPTQQHSQTPPGTNDIKYDQPFVPIIAQPPYQQQQQQLPQHPSANNNKYHEQYNLHQQEQQQKQQQQHYPQQQYPGNTIGIGPYDIHSNQHTPVNFYVNPSQSNKNQYGGADFDRHHPYGPDVAMTHGIQQPNGIVIASGKPSQTELYNILVQNNQGPINNGANNGLPPPPLPPSLQHQQQQQQQHNQQHQHPSQFHDNANLPPHIRIEHILQHLQSNEPNQIQHQQHLHQNNNQQQQQHQHLPNGLNTNYQTNRVKSQNEGAVGPDSQIIHIPITGPGGNDHGIPFNTFSIHHLNDGLLATEHANGGRLEPSSAETDSDGRPHDDNVVVEHANRGGLIDQRPSAHLPSSLIPTLQTGGPLDFDDNLSRTSPNLELIDLEAIDSHTVRIVFSVPRIYVNLHGRVELRYTNGANNDTSRWEQQTFAPPQDLIATSKLEFELPNLEPNSMYKIQIKLMLRDSSDHPTSGIYTVETPPERTITPPPPPTDYRPDFEDVFKNIEDPELVASESNSTWLRLSWKKLSDNDLEYVDGIQLRYKELNKMIYDATPLIHRTLTSYTIETLMPETAYEIGLYYIPFPGHGAELRAGNMITARTSPKVDVYSFDVMVNVTKVKSTSVEVSWSGVPYPEDKYVNIYRAIYQSDAGKEDSSVFKVAKRDSTTGTLIMDLKPGTRYRLWLETYLTNGKIKKSNVVNFVTKPGGPAPIPGKTGKLLTAGDSQPVGDYYGPLVVVAVVAALAVMSTLILLMILTRRRTHHTASITPPRKSEAAYDNPSYKVEIQQETMNL